MKWYSLKKYHPSTCVDLLIRAKHTKNGDSWFNFDRYFLASIDNVNCGAKLSHWEIEGKYDWLSAIIDEYEVTHFAFIEPVERE